jgi:septal ring factor EnvC (AmiA/AmiB activator)
MPIELLWIVPAIAVSVGFFIVLLTVQKERANKTNPSSRPGLYIPASNIGRTPLPTPPSGASEPATQRRIEQIEGKLGSLNEVLQQQQKRIEMVQRENNVYTEQVKELRGKLRSLTREYDIIMSENYSLRAKLKKFKRESTQQDNARALLSKTEIESREVYSTNDMQSQQVNLRLYGDTRKMNLTDFHDTGAIDLAELN